MADFSPFMSSFYNEPGTASQISPMGDPSFSELYGATRNLIPTQLNSINDMISQGINSPLIQAILGPSLARLMGTEQASRNAVTDAFRASGGLRGTPYGQAFNTNEQNIMQNRSNLISDTIAKNLGTLLSGQLQEQKNSFMPGEEYMNLLKLLRPDVVTNRGASGYNAGGGNPYGSFLDQPFTNLTGNTMPNPYPGNADPGLALTGVNYTPNPMPVAQPYYDPYQTNQPLPLNNFSQPSYSAPNPQDYITYGPWENQQNQQQPYDPYAGIYGNT